MVQTVLSRTVRGTASHCVAQCDKFIYLYFFNVHTHTLSFYFIIFNTHTLSFLDVMTCLSYFLGTNFSMSENFYVSIFGLIQNFLLIVQGSSWQWWCSIIKYISNMQTSWCFSAIFPFFNFFFFETAIFGA